jgi:CRISPR-associated protein Cmr1
MDIQFRTLTPIWTGDIGRDSSHVRETGILGSLRWWYEGIVRGMGGYACDPTEHTCLLDAEKYDNGVKAGLSGSRLLAHAGLCPACQLFGATGWKRRFRLNVWGLNREPLYFEASPQIKQAAEFWLLSIFDTTDKEERRAQGRNRTLPEVKVGALWSDEARLSILPAADDIDGITHRLRYALHFISGYGAMGAKTQNGFGRTLIEKIDPEVIREARRLIRADIAAYKAEHPNAKAQQELFSTRRFFSMTYELAGTKAADYITHLQPFGDLPGQRRPRYRPCAFDIRYKSVMGGIDGQGGYGMRTVLKSIFGRDTANVLLGSGGGFGSERSGSRIHVSHLYRTADDAPWRVRVFGYVPDGVTDDRGRLVTIDDVKQAVGEFLVGASGMFPGSVLKTEYK